MVKSSSKFRVLRYLVLIILSLGLFTLIPKVVKAQTIFLDLETMNKGYTVSEEDESFKVGIGPQVFQEPAVVKTFKTDSEGTILPQGKNPISSVYMYNVKVADPQVLEKPIFVSLKYDSNTPYKKRIHFWNRVTQVWQEIPSSLDLDNHQIRAAIHFPYSLVAVFEDPNHLDEPIKFTSGSGPIINSPSAIVIDDYTDKVLFEKNSNLSWPIASLTKIITALVFLDLKVDFEKVITYQSSDNAIGAKLYIQPGETLEVKDLFYTALVGSANNATKALVRATGLTQTEFVARMNQKAQELGLNNTYFTDPTGLDLGNQSTASDYAKLAQVALKNFIMLKGTTSQYYFFRTLNTQKPHLIKNTNDLLKTDLYITGGKTGYLDEARYCLVTKAKNQEGHEVIAIVLGNETSQGRFRETEELIKWAFQNYHWD